MKKNEKAANYTEWKKADISKGGTTWPELNPTSVAPKSTVTCSFPSGGC